MTVPHQLKAALLGLFALSLFACTQHYPSATAPQKTIVVTYSILGSLVRELAGDQFQVLVLIPNGLDPHEWEPSAKDVEAMNHADLIIQNGLGLEGGMQRSLAQVERSGVPFFIASDYIKIRRVKAGEGLPTGDADQATGAQDPHLWLDPQAMKAVVQALSAEIQSRFHIDLSHRAIELARHIDQLDSELQTQIATIPPAQRLLVTGHESMGYFAQHFGLKLIGAVVPSLTTEAEVSAKDLAALKRTIQGHSVKVIFTELGTPPQVSQALAAETNIHTVPIATHVLPADGSWFSLMRQLATSITQELTAP